MAALYGTTITPKRKMNMRDVGRHSNTHERPHLKRGNYAKLNDGSLESIDKVISVGAGYDRDDYYGDMVAAFSGNFTDSRLDLRGQVREWKAEALQHQGEGKMSMSRAEHRAAQFYKFMHRFTRSDARENFLKMAGGDPELAAQAMMEYTAKAGQNGQAGFGKGDADGIGGMGKCLGMEEYGGENGGVPFGMGDQPGDSHPATIAQAMRIAELLPRLRRKYSFAAGKTYTREESPYPADDMDLRPMRSYSEMMRVPTMQLAMDDETFYIKAAQKQLSVVEHFKLNPVVRHFGLAIDVSGSMTEKMGGGYHRYEYATAVAIALLEQAELGANRVSAVLFDGQCHAPMIGTPKEVAAKVWRAKFSGGGTAFQPVFNFFDKLDDLELGVMITDGGAHFDKKPKSDLQVLVCGQDGGAEALQKIAVKYDVVS